MIVLPGRTVGIIGGGQLGRMLGLAAKAMGYRIAVLDPQPDCPCGQVADIEITAEYGDREAIRKLAEVSDVVTYEFENVDTGALAFLEERGLLPQGRKTLELSRHRLREKTAIRELGIPVPEFRPIRGRADLEENVFYPSMLKTCTGGYDGKGQVRLKTPADLEPALRLAENRECILERWMPFDREISVIVARGTSGETAVFPVAENVHVNNILDRTIVPARISAGPERLALEHALKIATALGSVGILAVEMFVAGDAIYVNELAPRPHNSGHFSLDACLTDQFEQHIRAICGLPLGNPALHTHAVMLNILGEHLGPGPEPDLSPYIPLLARGKLHLYGKAEARPGRKMGHLTLLGDIEESLGLLERMPGR